MTEGFIHSVKVPRLYKSAAKIIQEVAEGGGSIKQLVFEKKHFNVNALYALVLLPIKKARDIAILLKRTNLLEKEPRFDPWLAKVLISELLWGKKRLPHNGCKPIQTILAYEQTFKAHLSDISPNNEKISVDAAKKKPRYVRINTLLITFEEALEYFQNEGWIITNPQSNYRQFLNQVENLSGNYFLKDIHVPNLIIFPSGTKFFGHVGYRNGWIILQDKASCLPAHILNPVSGSRVLDMCAAPGMKTTQLAAMLGNDATIYAVERDERRYKILEQMIKSSGATCVKTINNDILACTNDEFPKVQYILVDPSCSGSGMTDRLEFHEEQSKVRLEKLAGFQIKILRTALTRYPNVDRVVYSTCSTYPEENEDVVRQVLETNYVFKLVDAKKLVDENWLSFGSSDFGDIGKFCLYAKPDKDFTNGFFVAVFERLKEGEKNEFFNSKLFNYKKHIEHKRINREIRERVANRTENNDIKGISESVTLERNKGECSKEHEDSEGLQIQNIELHLENNQLSECEAMDNKKKKGKKSYSKKDTNSVEVAVIRNEDWEADRQTELKSASIIMIKGNKTANHDRYTKFDSKLNYSVEKIDKKRKHETINYNKEVSNTELIKDCTKSYSKLNCSVQWIEKKKKRETIDYDGKVCNSEPSDEDCAKFESKLNCSLEKIEKKTKKRKIINDDKQVSTRKLSEEGCTKSDSELNCLIGRIKKKKVPKIMDDDNQVSNSELDDEIYTKSASNLKYSVEKTKKKKMRKTVDDNQLSGNELFDETWSNSDSKLNCSVEKIEKNRKRKTIHDEKNFSNSEVQDQEGINPDYKLNCSLEKVKKKKIGKTIDGVKEVKLQLKVQVTNNEMRKEKSNSELMFQNKQKRKMARDNLAAFSGSESKCLLEGKEKYDMKYNFGVSSHGKNYGLIDLTEDLDTEKAVILMKNRKKEVKE